MSFEITFEGYTGAVEALVVDTTELDADSGTVVAAEVTSLQEGTEPLRGDFTLSFRGHETAALSYNADADEVKKKRCAQRKCHSWSRNNRHYHRTHRTPVNDFQA